MKSLHNRTVYIHRNKVNNKAYIGQTFQLLERRWREGEGYRSSPHFFAAIQKYGWDNFEHIIFETNLTEEQANRMEFLLIRLFKTTDKRFGYNLTEGGSANPGSLLSKSVMQYSLDGDYIATYSSQSEAERKTGTQASRIGKVCRGELYRAGNSIWRYENNPLSLSEIDKEHDALRGLKLANEEQKIPVCRVDLISKTIIDKFDSYSDAVRQTGIDRSVIYDDCKKKKVTARFKRSFIFQRLEEINSSPFVN